MDRKIVLLFETDNIFFTAGVAVKSLLSVKPAPTAPTHKEPAYRDYSSSFRGNRKHDVLTD